MAGGTRADTPSTLATAVPGGGSIELVEFYEEFRDYYPMCEMQTKRYFMDTVEADWVCIDAGANIGYHSILLGRVASEGLVYAFEPTRTFEMLVANLERNHVTNVVPVRKALGERSWTGTAPIFRIWGQDPEELETEFTTIDDFVTKHNLARVDLIKIDVDGYDLEVLKGARHTLARYSPVVIVELNSALATRGYTVSDAFDLMLAARYGAALVLDRDNYAFVKSWQLGEPWPSRLTLTMSHRHADEDVPMLAVGDRLNPERLRLVSHNNASILADGLVVAEGPAWSYAVSSALTPWTAEGAAVCCEVKVHSGSLGVLLTDASGTTILGKEEVVSEGSEVTVRLALRSRDAAQVVLRKTTDEPLNFRLIDLDIRRAQFDTAPRARLNHMASKQLAQVLGQVQGSTWMEIPLADIREMSTRELAHRLSIREPLEISPRLYDGDELIMERDDAPILKWLYQELMPERHFEFGTWEGFGTTLCLRSCDAEIWTVNLPSGEVDGEQSRYPTSREPDHPDSPYAQSLQPSDSQEAIGWMYRSAGLQHRVNQLYADSADLDRTLIPMRTFGTVFIDGGHTRKAVRVDTRTATELVAPDGLILWHDFTLDPLVLSGQRSTVGVVAAVADEVHWLRDRFELVSIKDSMILLGIPC